jgi:hypothetical protein
VLKVIRHRPVQAAVIAALAALVTTCAVLTPLYQRALEQASVQVQLAHAPASATQLQLTSTGVLPDLYSGSRYARPPLTTEELDALVPASLRGPLGTPIAARVVVAATDHPSASQGRLIWRDGQCAHVTMQQGHCPRAAGEIAVSTTDARNFGWRPGTILPAAEVPPKSTPGRPTTTTLTVAGVYASSDARFWDGWALTGVSGTQPDREAVAHDVWLAAEPTFETVAWVNPVSELDFPLDPAATGVDELLRLPGQADRLRLALAQRPKDTATAHLSWDVTALTSPVRQGRHQARTTVPLLMAPLGVLGLVVLWMALTTAAEQRRPEVAVARLRGRGVRGARGYLLRELLSVALAGVPVGVGVAFGLAGLARRLVLPGNVAVEVRIPVVVALALSIAAVTLTTWVVADRVGREPIAALLRRVPPRRPGWALGTTDAVALTASALIVGAFATGNLTGPLALAAPAVLALAVGLVVSRAAAPVATRVGRRLLRAGRPGPAVAFLQVARRPGVRGVIALLTVAAAILVFAGNAVAVGERNRAVAAAQEVGAPMVATLSGGSIATLEQVIGDAHAPDGSVTPVVVQHAVGYDEQANLFVLPTAFSRIAALPEGAAGRLARALAAPDVAPIRVRGAELTMTVATTKLRTGTSPVRLAARLLGADGLARSVPVAELPAGTTTPRTVTVHAGCAATCVLTGWQLLTDPANGVSGAVTVADVHASDATPVPLGSPSDWSVADPSARSALTATAATAGSLTIEVANAGRSDVLLQHRWLPTTVPAVVSGDLPQGASGRRFTGTGLAGDTPMVATARVRWLPRSGHSAAIANLAVAARSGVPLDPQAELQLWFDRDDPALLTRVQRAADARHMSVLRVDRESDALDELEQSASAWSLQLGVLVGVACLLVAALGVGIAGAASWRTRARDLAVLRLHGSPSSRLTQVSLGEQLPVILVAVLAGSASGMLAARVAASSVPLLPTAPAADLLDTSLDWPVVLVLGLVAAVALSALGWFVGALLVRRTTLDRLVDAG